jgi:methionyl-tRNA synthetase
MEKREHNKAMDAIWELVNHMNQYVNDKEPWKHKEDIPTFSKIIYNCLYGMSAATYLLQAFVPQTTQTAETYIGADISGSDLLDFGKAKYTLQAPEALFPKIDKK